MTQCELCGREGTKEICEYCKTMIRSCDVCGRNEFADKINIVFTGGLDGLWLCEECKNETL